MQGTQALSNWKRNSGCSGGELKSTYLPPIWRRPRREWVLGTYGGWGVHQNSLGALTKPPPHHHQTQIQNASSFDQTAVRYANRVAISHYSNTY